MSYLLFKFSSNCLFPENAAENLEHVKDSNQLKYAIKINQNVNYLL